jgi:UPF0755 protein
MATPTDQAGLPPTEPAGQARSSPGRGRRAVAVLLVVGAVLAGVAVWAVVREGPAAWVNRAMGVYLDLRASDLAAPGTDATPVTFVVGEGEGIASVAARLQAEGLVRSADALRLLARVGGLDRSVQAGQHTLTRAMSAREVLQDLQVGRAQGLRVTLPEGRRAEEVARVLAQAGVVDEQEFLGLVGTGVAAGPAVMDRPPGTGLEGYLFPDTYEFAPRTGAAEVVKTLLDNFERRLTPDLRAKLGPSGLSLFNVVTLASIVERETGVAAERPKVARVYLNRLKEPPYLLDADPTVQYGLGFQSDTSSWWKRPLLYEDLRSESAYNTYVHPGLPPGPIASPGLASIAAVLSPIEGPWMFFVANDVACDGTHVFAQSYEEHLANIRKYQTGGCGP